MPMSECTNSEVRDLLPLLASGGHVPSSAEVEAHVLARFTEETTGSLERGPDGLDWVESSRLVGPWEPRP
mgnify:CR=1 FL=1